MLQALGSMLYALGSMCFRLYALHSTMPQIKKIGARFARRFVVVLKPKNWGPHGGILYFLDRRLFYFYVCLSACLFVWLCMSLFAYLYVSVCHCLFLIVSVSHVVVG